MIDAMNVATTHPLHYVSANGLRFAYHEAGEGPLVVLLHGFPDIAPTYHALMTALAKAGYRAVAPYLRGYAPTEVPASGDCAPSTLGDDLAGLASALSPDAPAYVVGMDWGGTSIHAALVEHSDRLAAAVVMNAAHPVTLSRFALEPAQVRSVFHFWFFQPETAPRAVAAGDFQMVDYLWQLWSPTLDPGPHLDHVKTTLAQPGVLPVALQYYRDLYESAVHRSFPTGTITTATLSIFGALDPTSAHSQLEEPFFVGPYERLALPDVGHWPHLERPDLIAQRVVDWFRLH